MPVAVTSPTTPATPARPFVLTRLSTRDKITAMNILDELDQNHGSDIQRQLMNQLGLTKQQAASVLPKVGPLILGALKQQKDLHGEDHVQGHVQQFGAEDFSDIGSMLRGGADAHDPALGGLLGDKGHEATQMMAQRLGISAGTAVKLIPMLAPIIIGMLRRKSSGGAPGGIPGTGGGGLGGLGSILDRDGDGQILDDLGSIFMGGNSGGSAKSGCLSSILGGLLKGRR